MTTFSKEGDEILLSVAAGQTADVTLTWTGAGRGYSSLVVHLRDADTNDTIGNWNVNPNTSPIAFSHTAATAQDLRLLAGHVSRDAACEATLALAP